MCCAIPHDGCTPTPVFLPAAAPAGPGGRSGLSPDGSAYGSIAARCRSPSKRRRKAAFARRAGLHVTVTPVQHFQFVRGSSAARVIFVPYIGVRREYDAQPRKVLENRHFTKDRQRALPGRTLEKWQKSAMHPCVRCVIIICGSDAKHRGPKYCGSISSESLGALDRFCSGCRLPLSLMCNG